VSAYVPVGAQFGVGEVMMERSLVILGSSTDDEYRAEGAEQNRIQEGMRRTR